MRLTKIFHQSGRSLVEVLAVLAIMGLLSLAGIYGIGYAMEANRENETLNRFSKVVAGSRTSRILENLGDKTKYKQDATGAERKEYAKMAVDMHDVISNIGDDIYSAPAEDIDGELSVISYIVAPLQGPADEQGTKENVKIYVYVQTPDAFTVHADNLTFDACMKIVQSNLGYTFTYETAEAVDRWRVPSQVQTQDGARALCEKVVQGTDAAKIAMIQNPFVRQALAVAPIASKPGTLVMWFGPYACMGDGCASGLCNAAECCCEFTDGGRQVKLKDPAPVGCKPAAGGCYGCATPDSTGVCMPKPGFSSCEPECPVNVCQSAENPYYCGNGLCCPSKATCGKDSCTGKPVECKDPARPNVCGTQCCGVDEECDNGICEPKDKCIGTQQSCLKQTDGSFSHCCGQNETCCGTTCCGTAEVCMPDGTCAKPGPGQNEYCVASIFKTGRCIKKEICDGKVLSIPGHTVQRCEEDPTKDLIYVYGGVQDGVEVSKNKCLFTLCAGGRNGQPCCPCTGGANGSPVAFECLNHSCSLMSAKDVYELNECMGFTPPEETESDGDGGGGGPPPAECNDQLSEAECKRFKNEGAKWCEEKPKGSGNYKCCCTEGGCKNG